MTYLHARLDRRGNLGFAFGLQLKCVRLAFVRGLSAVPIVYRCELPLAEQPVRQSARPGDRVLSRP
jgi:hypothetical protein